MRWCYRSVISYSILSVLILRNTIPLNGQPVTALSRFDTTQMRYKGTAAEQTDLLLKKVVFWGKVDHRTPVPETSLRQLAGTSCLINKDSFENYLATNHIDASKIGGSVRQPVSYITHRGKKIYAAYFVIHDVSTPVYKNTFPPNIDSANWPSNRADRWKEKITHVYVTRTGETSTATDFKQGLRATKMELRRLGEKSRGLFLHVELVQPRVYPPGTVVSAPVAPEPGFTSIQYEKLALLYVAASIRKGEWLIPAYHATIDETLDDGHDDPQHFELTQWADAVNTLLKKLSH